MLVGETQDNVVHEARQAKLPARQGRRRGMEMVAAGATRVRCAKAAFPAPGGLFQARFEAQGVDPGPRHRARVR